MDHPYVLTWGLATHPVGAGRGPGSTSGISGFEQGQFRSGRAAFRVEIGNWGWDHATFSPDSDVVEGLERQGPAQQGLRGPALRAWLTDRLSRQVRLGFLVEQLPDPHNRVEVDPNLRTTNGSWRPVIHYRLDDYTRRGIAAALDVSSALFARASIEDHTRVFEDAPGRITLPDGRDAVFHGAGHLGGTHRMGRDPRGSVVDPYQRSWDHPNLFITGCGSMPTLGTANPTLTAVALALRTADHLVGSLQPGCVGEEPS